jgi:ubiquinone/menaquinone biosynthesis C-methylase UbiE
VNDERVPIGLGDGFDPDACGQDERKYSAANPVVRWLIDRLCKRVAEVIGPASGVILDVGTGEGLAIERVTGSLDEHRPDGTSRSVIGVEYRAAKVRAARQRNPQMAAVVADIGMLPFRDGSIGTVLCMEVLEHLDG